MAEPLKNIYNKKFFKRLTNSLEKVIDDFNDADFIDSIFNEHWDSLELKQRMRHITLMLNKVLSGNFPNDITTIQKLIPILIQSGFKADNLEFIFLPDYLEVYGLNYFKESVKAIENITQFVTCEFAVRAFIQNFSDKMMKQMLKWSTHKHPMVRRLATEGCRPRLPWALGIPALKKDPGLIFLILENLKNDHSDSVRRSVANNLNDISKDHPEIILSKLKLWDDNSTQMNQLLKHASRTLLKRGNSEVMEFFGFGSIKNIDIKDFKLKNRTISIGDYLEFEFSLCNYANESLKLRLEYAIYYQKANQSLFQESLQNK